MRVLYFSQDYSPHDHRFLSALAGADHEVFYLRLTHARRQVEDRPVPSRIQQVQWNGAGEQFRWRAVPRLRSGLLRILRELRPDLVHAGPIQTCAFLAALSGFRPLLTMSWGFDLMQDADRNTWWRWVTRYTLKRSAFFVSDARVTCDKAISFGMPSGNTAVFPWGVDLDHFKPAGIPAASPFVLFCNRSWEPRYGVDVLARAFVKVAHERPDATLLLLGGGSMGGSLRQILMSGNVLDRVQFAGYVSQADLPRWYRMASLYISPSHVDGSSVSLMEALACGLPVLVSDIPANREWVTDGANGWLFPDGDAQALAGSILALLDRPDDLTHARVHARQCARERADWSRNFAVLLEAYRQAVQVRH